MHKNDSENELYGLHVSLVNSISNFESIEVKSWYKAVRVSTIHRINLNKKIVNLCKNPPVNLSNNLPMLNKNASVNFFSVALYDNVLNALKLNSNFAILY